MESTTAAGRIDDEIRSAFRRSHGGYSSDRVVADPALNGEFVDECRRAGLVQEVADLNRRLINLRKSGHLRVRTTRRTTIDDSDYQFASEIAVRFLERRDQVSLDDILCDPELASNLDAIASDIVPGRSPLEYRWSALGLRKIRELRPEIATKLLRSVDARIQPLSGLNESSIPNQPGVYCFSCRKTKQCLYVGECNNLQQRLKKHADHSDNKFLAQYLWSNSSEEIILEYYVLPSRTTKPELRAVEAELIERRDPTFNVQGRDR